MVKASKASRRKLCGATKKDGSKCRARVNPGWDHCIGHDSSPATVEGRKRGGRHTAKPIRAMKLMPSLTGPLAEQLVKAISDVYEGKLSPQRLSAMAAGAGAWLKLLNVGLLEERVRELEGKTK